MNQIRLKFYFNNINIQRVEVFQSFYLHSTSRWYIIEKDYIFKSFAIHQCAACTYIYFVHSDVTGQNDQKMAPDYLKLGL